MELGNFSLSLTVEDLAASRAFYEVLGFAQIAGEPENGWIILKNGDAKIGLFHGMFEENLVTFNPLDARSIERALLDSGCEVLSPTVGDTGPCHLVVCDPDGNKLLIDQHQ